MKALLPKEFADRLEPHLTGDRFPDLEKAWVELPNVFITPHTFASSPHSIDRIVNLFLDNLQRYRKGQPLRNVVGKSTGY